METATDLIHFRCIAPGHDRRLDDGGPADTLTIHQGKWSFCAHSVHADGHVWSDTGGVPVQNLRGPLGTIRLDLAPAAEAAPEAVPSAAPTASRARRKRPKP